jgi:hypothetical protein
MPSTMGRGLAAAFAFALFATALLAFFANLDRIAGVAALAGLMALSLAILAFVSDRRHD